ncbi:hypothetical protein OG21DRAFT_1516429 [Imleria badia]|nr:hypothetical protein OG21DRAFT_1516429 [Imleria badia]
MATGCCVQVTFACRAQYPQAALPSVVSVTNGAGFSSQTNARELRFSVCISGRPPADADTRLVSLPIFMRYRRRSATYKMLLQT